MVEASPELLSRMRNTQILLEQYNNGLISQDDLNNTIANNPDKYIDVNTYLTLIKNKPWADILPSVVPTTNIPPPSPGPSLFSALLVIAGILTAAYIVIKSK